jgi:hypothetical protein
MRAGPAAAAFAAALVVIPFTAEAQKAEKADRCIAASERGQQERDRGALVDARASFRACVADDCPAMLRKDCGRWLEDVEQGIPTIVLGARDSHGDDVIGARVLVDGTQIFEVESGRAVALDPGPHLIRFEKPPAAPVEQTVVLRMGERNRPILVTFAAPVEEKAPAPPHAPPASRARISPWVFVAGGVGVAGVGAFAYFGATGLSEKSRLRAECAPTCTDDQVAPVRNRYLAADISLGIGIVAFAIAGYLFFHTADPATPTATRVTVAPTPGGAAFSLTHAF